MSGVEVESSDVIRLILQYLQENGLSKSVSMLQEESQVSFNVVESIQNFTADIRSGQWDSVLNSVATLKLPQSLLSSLYEQIVLELIELRDLDAAKTLLRGTDALATLKMENPQRYLRLERLASKTYFDPSDAYAGRPKAARREALAASLAEHVVVVPPSRLLSLLSVALSGGSGLAAAAGVGSGGSLDLLRGVAVKDQDNGGTEGGAIVGGEAHAVPTTLKYNVQFPAGSRPEAMVFIPPGGTSFVTGSSNGIVQVWESDQGKPRLDLGYQAESRYMSHAPASVLALTMSSDGSVIGTGASDGSIRVWNVASGKALRKFPKAHSGPVSALEFVKANAQLLSGSHDTTLRLHGLKSGKLLKELRGHTAFVTAVTWPAGVITPVSGSADGTIRVWDAKSGSALATIRPPPTGSSLAGSSLTSMAGASGSNDASVCAIAALPFVGIGAVGADESGSAVFVVAARTSALYVMDTSGKVRSLLNMPRRSARSGDGHTTSAISAALEDDGSSKKKDLTGASTAAKAAAETTSLSGMRDVFVDVAVSPRGGVVYGLSAGGTAWAFDVSSGEVLGSLAVGGEDGVEVLGMTAHPTRAGVLTTWSADGTMKTWG